MSVYDYLKTIILPFVEDGNNNPEQLVNLIEERYTKKVPIDGKGEIFMEIGLILKNSSYHHHALRAFNHALNYEIADHDAQGEAYGNANIGSVYYRLGNYTMALEFHKKALGILKEIPDIRGESYCYTNIGNVYYDLGDYTMALQFHQQALGLLNIHGSNVQEILRCNTHLGNTYYSLGDYTSATKFHSEVLEIARKNGLIETESVYYGNLGNDHHARGDYKDAIKLHERALEIAQMNRDRQGESRCYLNLARSHDRNGDYDKALWYYEKAKQMEEQIGDRHYESITNLNLASFYLRHYKNEIDGLQIARDYCDRSIDLIESIGGNIIGEELQIGFYSGSVRNRAYELMVTICLALKDGKEAFDYVEKSKSKALLNMLSSTEIQMPNTLETEYPDLLIRKDR